MVAKDGKKVLRPATELGQALKEIEKTRTDIEALCPNVPSGPSRMDSEKRSMSPSESVADSRKRGTSFQANIFDHIEDELPFPKGPRNQKGPRYSRKDAILPWYVFSNNCRECALAACAFGFMPIARVL